MILNWIRRIFSRPVQVAHRGGEQSPPRPGRAFPAAPLRSDQVFWLGGKPYVALIEGTSERDDYVMRLAGKAGLREVSMRRGETPEAFAQRLLYDLVDAEVRHDILGGLLIPRGEKPENWSPSLAENTAKHFRMLTSEEDKSTLNGLTAGFLGDFFERGLSSLLNSPTASEGTAQVRDAQMEETTALGSGAV